jgi:hypothetical protein
MNGIGGELTREAAREAARDGARIVHERLCASRVGRRWERIARTHALEIKALVAVHPDLERRVSLALWLLAGAARRAGERVDAATVDAAAAVLDDLDRLGTLELRREAQALREELADVRGHSLAELLAG